MEQLKKIIWRELVNLWNNRPLLFLVVLGPILLGLILGGIFSNKVVSKLPIAVLDLDQSKLSRLIVRNLDATRSLDIQYQVESMPQMEALIYDQSIVAGILIPSGLAQNIKKGKAQVITAYVNGSNLVTANLVLADLKTTFAILSAGIKLKYLQKTGSTEEKATALVQAVKVDITKLYNPGFNYLNYLAPGIWIAVLSQIILLWGSLFFVMEVENGTAFELTHWSIPTIIVGKILPALMITMIIFEIFFRAMFPLFGIEFKGSIPLLFVISILYSLCLLSLGFLISMFSKRGVDAVKGVLLIGSPAFILSGYSWPTSAMPLMIQPLSYLLPLTPYLSTLRKIYQQGGGFAHVQGDILTLLLMTVLFLAIVAILLKRRLQQEVKSVSLSI
ncbi:MAG: ABC transporter permease [Oligoflexia bacterium]|nr:ABC transporter permease [Oligoflexia bacterium]MBF0365626.1 ABC transporter permease [Oligoflexia bacterium]